MKTSSTSNSLLMAFFLISMMASRALVLILYPETPFSEISSTISQSGWVAAYSLQAIFCMGISS